MTQEPSLWGRSLSIVIALTMVTSGIVLLGGNADAVTPPPPDAEWDISLEEISAPPYYRLAFTEKDNQLFIELINNGESRAIVIVDIYHVEPDDETESFLKTIHFGAILPSKTKSKETSWEPSQTGRNWIHGEIYVKGHGNERIFVNEFKESFNVVPGWRPVLELGLTVITEPTTWDNLTVVIDGDLYVNAPLDIVNTDVIGDDLTVFDEYTIGQSSSHDMAASSDGQYKVEILAPSGIFNIYGKLWNNPDNAHYWFYMNGTLNVGDDPTIPGHDPGTIENTHGSPDLSQPGGIICTT